MADKKEKPTFEDIIGEKKIVLVDCFATWCGPCKMMTPILEEIEKEYENDEDVKVIQIDTDENPAVAAKYNVMSVPTFLLFKEGKENSRMVGMTAKEALVEKIEELKK